MLRSPRNRTREFRFPMPGGTPQRAVGIDRRPLHGACRHAVAAGGPSHAAHAPVRTTIFVPEGKAAGRSRTSRRARTVPFFARMRRYNSLRDAASETGDRRGVVTARHRSVPESLGASGIRSSAGRPAPFPGPGRPLRPSGDRVAPRAPIAARFAAPAPTAPRRAGDVACNPRLQEDPSMNPAQKLQELGQSL